MTTERIVSTPMGSWKWQNAYRISEYSAVACKDGKLRWRSIRQSGKFSEPQLRRSGLDHIPFGSLHHKELSVEDAAQWRVERMEALGVR